ncbi:hypothetical protein VTO42DRAFT_3968 [Malbranchea cinnamomea]
MVKPSAAGVSSSGTPSQTASIFLPNEGDTTSEHSAGTVGETENYDSSMTSVVRTSHDAGVRTSKASEESPCSFGDTFASASQSTEVFTNTGKTTHVAVASNDGIDTPQSMPGNCPLELVENQVTDDHPTIAKLRAEHEAVELQWQAELHIYVEKIDALQSKLRYLAREAADSAKNASITLDPASLERKLLEKDMLIANLMEEGQKLSKVEMEHRALIKQLRQRIVDYTKSLADARRRIESVEKDLAMAEEKASRLETAEQRAVTKLNALSEMEKELETVSAQRDEYAGTITDLKSQLTRALARAELAERRITTDSAEKQSRHIAQLQDDLASAKVERELSEEKFRREIHDLRHHLGREKERARLLEAELRGERSAMESKMECLRVRAEEVSSSATGDAQAKLLRQIETLQTQYAVASQNWHGIESSLLSRLENLEKERDDLARKEGDLRRKVREVNLKSKRIEGELENSREVIQELERNLVGSKQELERLSCKLATTEEELVSAKRDFVRQKENLESIWAQRLDDERTKWQEQCSLSTRVFQRRTESPVTSSRGLESLATAHEKLGGNRLAELPVSFSEIDTPPGQNSHSPNSAFRSSNDLSTQSVDILSAPFDSEDYLNGAVISATPSAQDIRGHSASGINDMVSVSTVGTGPSVQLVARMSATIRRLESERAALKDELARLTTQRDEARQEVVELMREVEEKRACDKRVKELEETVEQLDQRYQTTLEMLGEKSEQVEEQKADIEDLKKIYRELIESVIK